MTEDEMAAVEGRVAAERTQAAAQELAAAVQDLDARAKSIRRAETFQGTSDWRDGRADGLEEAGTVLHRRARAAEGAAVDRPADGWEDASDHPIHQATPEEPS